MAGKSSKGKRVASSSSPRSRVGVAKKRGGSRVLAKSRSGRGGKVSIASVRH